MELLPPREFEVAPARGGMNPLALELLANMSEQDLILLYSDLIAILPQTKLKDLDLEQELVLQLRAAQALQNKTMKTSNDPLNQVAQVMNSVTAIIQNIVKMQSEVYDSERIKRIEQILIKVLRSWPEEMTVKFFEEYEKELQIK